MSDARLDVLVRELDELKARVEALEGRVQPRRDDGRCGIYDPAHPVLVCAEPHGHKGAHGWEGRRRPV